ncbi:hypothetical protein MATL_G00264240 [Megalops atlanticus]|uniref:C2H2-type domain-containing protein n=1 Tax=Megalops atlanticus TaxID=7932 RepID=A0A9D3SVI5_MEGAT|nr:hypothetical protein MATL_G00264240 [Megalops atlanticus]
MKTPDFDDLLAAFDIPDATGLDAKEAIQTSHDEGEGPLNAPGMCMDNGISIHYATPALDVPAVSVIVKNSSRQDSFESAAERDAAQLGGLVQNGFRSVGPALDYYHMGHGSYGKFEASFRNGDSVRGPLAKRAPHRADRVPFFSQFSPISSPESKDAQGNGIDVIPKQEETPFFPTVSMAHPADLVMVDSQRKLVAYSMFDKCYKRDAFVRGQRSEETRTESHCEGSNKDHIKMTGFLGSSVLPLDDPHSMNLGETNNYFVSESGVDTSRQCVKASTSKLSSSLAALVALNAKKDAEASKEKQTSSSDLLVTVNETPKVNLMAPKSPKSLSRPLEVVKRFLKQPDSPVSVCSDSSDKASPSVTTGSPPAIPRVRIKTIKTSSGQIKHTVTSVLPDSEVEHLWSPTESTLLQPFKELLPSPQLRAPSQYLTANVVFQNGRSKSSHKITPSVTLPLKVTCVMAEGNSKMKARGQSSAPFQNTSSTLMRSVNIVQQQHRQQKTVLVQMAHTLNTSFLPKAVHLANLNVVPHSMAASVTARSTTQRQSQPQISTPMVCSTIPLVHQVKKATPLSCASFPIGNVGTFNRLLNAANPIPTYMPNLSPPPESGISLPDRGYRCLECGDSFGLERSLVQHYSRRSVHIEVACMHCSKSLVFLNKCSLLAHAREHKSKGAVMQCTQLFMKPIPANQMFTPAVTEPAVPAGSRAPPPGPASLASSAKVKPVMPLYPDKIIRHGLKCLECNMQLTDYRSLAGHYQRFSEETEGLTCELCLMMLPNRCSYKAHKRVHTHKSPYCCPECGAVSRSIDIQKHVKENCLHYSRKIGNQCLHCDMFYMSFQAQKRHIEEQHCEVFYECSLCPVASKSVDGCLIHIKNKHNSTTVAPQLIYKCTCEKIFKKKQLLFDHFHQNAKKQCVFKCPECAVVFSQKQPLMQHFKGVHADVFKAAVDISVKKTEEAASSRQEARGPSHLPKMNSSVKHTAAASRKDSPATLKSNSKLTLKNAGWTCGECLHWLLDREAYVSHMQNSHGKSLKKYPCQWCERSFNSTTSLRRHLRNDHMGKRKTYTCWYCTGEKVTFTKYFMLKNHIGLIHGIKNPDFSQMASQETSQGSREKPGDKRRGEEAQREGAGGTTLEATPPKRPKPQFRCAKCGFTAEDSTSFQEHIPQHKGDDSTPQCLHCGLCFASQLALSRHLFIVHKIKEPEQEEDKEEEEEQEVAESPPTGEEVDSVTPVGQTRVEQEAVRLHCDASNETFDSKLTQSSNAQLQRQSS